MQKKTFLFFGNGPYTNRGCEAIARSTMRILEREFGDSLFINAILSPVSPDSLKIQDKEEAEKITHHIRTFVAPYSPYGLWIRLLSKLSLPIPFEFEKYLAQAEAALALGGDNYTLDYGDPKWYFQASSAVLRHKKPMVLWGASVGPFISNPKFEKYAFRELKKATLICARESQTVRYLTEIGVSDNVKMAPDPAFVLPAKAVEPLPDELSFIGRDCIGLNLSPLLGKYMTGGHWFELARECLSELLRCVDLPVALIPHVTCPHTNDYIFLKQLYETMPEHHQRLFLVGPQYDCCRTKWIISKMTVFVGARTHSTIASLSNCIPTLSLGYSMKSRGINQDIFGHCDWMLPVDQIEPAAFAEKVKHLVDCRSDVSNYLNGMMETYKNKAWNAGTLLRNMLEKQGHIPPKQ
jgi:colanic acid/amylovoran biosynthesis protein